MAIGHPSEYFLRYTLAQAWGDDDQDVTQTSLDETLDAFGLPKLTEKSYDRLRATFNPPEGFRFHNHKHKETRDWMKDQKIFTLWKPESDDRRVIPEIVDGHMLVKHDIHLLLLGFIPHGIIAEKVSTKYRLNPVFTERMISTYYHYFWNVSRATYEQWEGLLEGKRYKDSFMAALMCGEQQALYRAGFSPRVDGNRAMKEAYRQAFFRMEALRFQPDTKSTFNAYAQLTARMVSVHDILYAQGSGLQDQLKQFRQVMMKHKDPDVAAIDRIIDKMEGGSYSGDGSAEEEEPKQGDLQ